MKKIKLIAVSQPNTKEIDCQTAEDVIAYCARVSAPKNQTNHATGPKLIQYLVNENHWSPLEMVNMTIEINTTRDIARQVLRHRSFAYQEFSQRYGSIAEFGDGTLSVDDFVLREARLQDKKNRQNSIEINDPELQAEWNRRQTLVIETAIEQYLWALDNKIAKEQARAVLPEGNTPSRLYMQGSIRSWIHYIALRSANGTQKEHIDIALGAIPILQEHFPNTSKLFETLL